MRTSHLVSSVAAAAALVALAGGPAAATPGTTSPQASCMAQGVVAHAVLDPGAIAERVAFIKSLPFVDNFGRVISEHAQSADCGA